MARLIAIKTLAGFRDWLGRPVYDEEIKKGLMDHAESGMAGRYGTQKQSRAVDIVELNEAVQSQAWPFLGNVRSTCAC